jgi:hypothetical protein
VGLFFWSSMESSGVIFGLKAPHRGGAPKNRGIIASGYNTKRQSDILLARSLLKTWTGDLAQSEPPKVRAWLLAPGAQLPGAFL